MGGIIMRTVFVFIPIIILLLTPCVVGSVSFTFDSEIILPDSLGSAGYSFDDLDGDGYDEVIVDNNYLTTVYSIQENRVTDYFIKKADTLKRRYTYGYIDDDSLLDYFEIVLLGPQDIFTDDFGDSAACGLLYLSTNDFIPTDTTLLYETPPFEFEDDYDINYISELFLKDDYSDDQPEVYFKLLMYHYHCYPGHILCREYTYYSNFMYIPGDDSPVAIAQLPSNIKGIYQLYNDSDFYAVRKTDYAYDHWDDIIGYRSYHETWSNIEILDRDSIILSKKIDPIYTCPISIDGWERQYSLIKKYWTENLSSFTAGYEFVATVYQSASGYDGYGPFPDEPNCFDSSYHLACYDLSSPDSISEIWNIEYESDPGIDFIFSDSLYPDRFLTFINNRIYEHRSYDGSIADSSDILSMDETPIAYRSINLGGSRYLIMQSNNTLKFYTIDVVVPVEEESPELLPSAFSIGEPYPNPYNAQVTIPLSIPSRCNLTVSAYNILGQKVDIIHEGEVPPGKISLNWNSAQFSSGVYFIRASTEELSATVKALLLK